MFLAEKFFSFDPSILMCSSDANKKTEQKLKKATKTFEHTIKEKCKTSTKTEKCNKNEHTIKEKCKTSLSATKREGWLRQIKNDLCHSKMFSHLFLFLAFLSFCFKNDFFFF
jgi:hypothetical protein